jgi:hypothetical protein
MDRRVGRRWELGGEGEEGDQQDVTAGRRLRPQAGVAPPQRGADPAVEVLDLRGRVVRRLEETDQR